MQDSHKPARRRLLKTASLGLAMIPLLGVAQRAAAATSPVRGSLKYQDKPSGDKNCAGCMQFVPGKAPADLGGCKIMAGDTEISPHGYCVAWVAAPKK